MNYFSWDVSGCVEDKAKSSILEDLELVDVLVGSHAPDLTCVGDDW